jgi:hypothetical protein
MLKLDLSKAFGRVDRMALLKSLRTRAVPELNVRFCLATLRHTRYTFLHLATSTTDPCTTTTGISYGRSDATEPFVTVLHDVLRPCWADCVAQGRGLPHEHGTVPFLQYVGDIILLAPGPRQLGAMANYLVAQLRAVGFVLSDDKTQWAATSSVHRRSIKVNGTTVHALPTSSTLNALGVRITPNGEFPLHETSRWPAMAGLSHEESGEWIDLALPTTGAPARGCRSVCDVEPCAHPSLASDG